MDRSIDDKSELLASTLKPNVRQRRRGRND
jgi:hypothetical protein